MAIRYHLVALALCAGILAPNAVQAVQVTFHVKEKTVTRDVNRAFQNKPLSGWCIAEDRAGNRYHPVEMDNPAEELPGYFYFWDHFTLDLKPDVPYKLHIERGLGWLPFEEEVTLAKGQSEVTLYMDSWINLSNRRWLASDLDARFIFMDPALAMDAQGLNLVCRVVKAASAVSDLEKRSKGFNHLPNERAFTGRDWSFGDFNVLATLDDLVLEDETPFKSAADLRPLQRGKNTAGFVDIVSPSAVAAPIAAALGLSDFVRVVGPEKEPGEVWEEDRILERFEAYYTLLNAGFRLPVSAGSMAAERKPFEWDRLGSSRVYTRVKGALSLGIYLETMRNGANWATNGPALTLQVNGKDPGFEFPITPPRNRLRISMGVRSNHPLDRLELVHNGRVVETLIGSATQDFVLKDFIYEAQEPGWIAARAFEKPHEDGTGIGYAHTSPFYLTLPETPSHRKETLEDLVAKTEAYRREIEENSEIESFEKELVTTWCDEALKVFQNRLNQWKAAEEDGR